jgi:hypothetical protein
MVHHAAEITPLISRTSFAVRFLRRTRRSISRVSFSDNGASPFSFPFAVTLNTCFNFSAPSSAFASAS